MKILLLLLIVLYIATQLKSMQQPQHTHDSPPVAQLRAEVHSRHLTWFIICAIEGPAEDHKFFGAVQPKDNPFYIEDGGKPYWSTFGSTQDEVAQRLHILIQGPPNMDPEHKEKERKRLCPPELSGS